jgi:hypothetical protein
MTTKIKLSSNVGDVDISTTPTNGQALVYSTASSKWVPGAAAGGGVTTYSTIDDLPLSGVSEGALALVDSTNKLYLWMDTGWYNIATINTNPSITSGNDTPYLLAIDGTPTVITLVASDPEGIPITWSYEVTSGSLTNGGGTTATVSNDGDGQFTITPTTTEDYAGAFSITFKASDGVNLGTALSEFTLAFRVLDSKYTTLLVKAEAAGANATFVDGSTNAFTVTKNGDVTQGTFSPFSQPDGAWSNYFDGTGDYLSLPSSPIPSTGDFTIECWVKIESYNPTTDTGIFYFFGNSAGSAGVRCGVTSSGNIYFLHSTNGTTWEANSGPLTTLNRGVWYHVAATRNANAGTFWLNGVSIYTLTFTTMYAGTYNLIGAHYNGSAIASNCHISNMRVINGTAVYTTDFTPPATPLTAITNTSLLTCQSNRFKDNSTNGFAITVAGNTAISPFCPFDRTTYASAVHGGSAYFDGIGDYLSIPALSAPVVLGTGDFTAESWVYVPSNAALQFLFGDLRWQNGYQSGWALGIISTKFTLRQGPGGGGWDELIASSAVQPNTWHHVAISRSSGTMHLFVNGVLEASKANTFNYTNAESFKIGAAYIDGGLNNLTGYIANVRVVKGTALYTTNFTPPTEPLTAITNTSLLLNCDNGSIIDYSSKNNLKLFGNTTASATQTKYAARSVYFDGSGDYITSDRFDLFDFGASDFTVECWVKTTDTDSVVVSCANAGGATNTNWGIYVLSSAISFYASDGSTYQISALGATVVTDGAWHHVAATRSGSSFRFFFDGTQVGSTATWSGAISSTSRLLRIGDNGTGAAATYYTGYIEDLRITKGLARYTANFTPPTTELLG